MPIKSFFFAFLISGSFFSVHAQSIESSALLDEFRAWRGKYPLTDSFKKLTDDRGNGYEDLYGTRNFRVVLHGVFYRGGANNKNHRTNPRGNQNPLPNDGLTNLCEEGFGQAIYFYDENFETAPNKIDCQGGRHLDYLQITAFDKNNVESLLEIIYKRIKGASDSPIYGHCWNGWHASGLISALALRQFCGWNAANAQNYWKKNTDGNDQGYASVLKRIADFVPYEKFQISSEEKSVICPLGASLQKGSWQP